jgi:D-hexose-6-phosphate mutarotase
VEGTGPIRIIGETDRTYLSARGKTAVRDEAMKRTIVIDKSGSDSTVLWNPWIGKAKAMADFGDEEWKGMVCVETANIASNAITLAPGASHAMRATIRVEAVS